MANKNISSKSLFHFTSGIRRLENILSSHCINVSYCTEYFWGGYKFALPMACFCDIPLSQVTEHMSTYGCFGIGFNSDWSEIKKLTSVIYAKSESELSKNVGKWLKTLCNNEGALSDGDIYLLSHVKKYYGEFIKRDNCIDKKKKKSKETKTGMKTFYQEREWRYVPPKLKAEQIKVEKNNDKNDFSRIEVADKTQETLPFDYNDISYIIVHGEDDRRKIIKEMGKLKLDNEEDKYILMSKVLTAIQIKNDF